jgi:hypothetical protein
MHTYRPGNHRDEIPKRRRLWPTPGCNAMEEEEEEEEEEVQGTRKALSSTIKI